MMSKSAIGQMLDANIFFKVTALLVVFFSVLPSTLPP